ncbi:hypothetical protein ACH6EH_07225 [Paenibacillus sp. JSM ZJ436]|uniref:hypothetical protein n=1 Tax=Paenibacillus sp. JSM ZJ436 TaxID=3376190 RepID=UPI0037B906C1
MSDSQTYDISMSNKDENQGITFKELYEDMLGEIDYFKKLGLLDELMNQPIKLNLVDSNGKVVEGPATLAVGWLESDDVLITGNIENVFE